MKLRYKVVVCLFVIAALVLPWPLLADVCRVQRVVHPVYHYGQNVVLKNVYPPYYYAVGTELQLDALAEKLSQRIEAKLKLKEKSEEPKTVLSTKCATCHSPGKQAVTDGAPAFFDAEGKLTATAEQKASMKTAARLGAMPPSKELDDDSYLQMVRELEKSP